jgi:hypothetical protein
VPERSLQASGFSSTPGSATPTGSPDATSRRSGWRLRPGDYGIANGPETIAVVERKTLENLAASISDGTMAFQMQRLGEVGRAAVVVEGRYSACSSSSTFRPPSSPTGSPGCRFGIPRSRSCSPIRGSSPRSGPIGSSQPLFRTRVVMIRLQSEDVQGSETHRGRTVRRLVGQRSPDRG